MISVFLSQACPGSTVYVGTTTYIPTCIVHRHFVNTADMYDMSGALIRDVPLCSSRLPQAAALDGGSVINWLTASDAAPSAVYSP